jgi:hypothetical protein
MDINRIKFQVAGMVQRGGFVKRLPYAVRRHHHPPKS